MMDIKAAIANTRKLPLK
jgi:hypothetical protein